MKIVGDLKPKILYGSLKRTYFEGSGSSGVGLFYDLPRTRAIQNLLNGSKDFLRLSGFMLE